MPLHAAFPRVPVVPIHADARVSSAQTSQALFGHLLLVLGAQGAWRRVRTARDGYEGWAHEGYLDEFALPDLDALVASEPDFFGATAARRWPSTADEGGAGSEIATGGDGPGAEPRPHLSLGCEVEDGGRRLRLPVGAVLHAAASRRVVAGETLVMGGGEPRFAARGDAVVATARRYFDSTSYQWGGVTPWGADCSGLAQSVYALHGVDLPRDAWQQAEVGADAGRDLRVHRPGDLLFFSDRDDRRVTHVGLATGDGAMCHLALGRGGWAEDALTEPADAYAERLASQLVAARRVLA